MPTLPHEVRPVHGRECLVFRFGDGEFLVPRFLGPPVGQLPEAPPGLTAPPLGQRRYQVESLLSAGGFGVILVAHDLRLSWLQGNQVSGHEVLLKMIRYEAKTFSMDAAYARRKIAERRTGAAFEKFLLNKFNRKYLNNLPNINDFFIDINPNLLRTFLAEDDDGNETPWQFDPYSEEVIGEPYLALEGIQGTTLSDLLQRHGPMDEAAALRMAKEVCSVLSVLHTRKDKREIFHGDRRGQKGAVYYLYQDLKPDNILVSDDTYFTLIDFGAVAEIVDGVPASPTAGYGTLGYYPSESLIPPGLNSVDPRTDLYILGATLYQVLTGIHPTDLAQEQQVPVPVFDPKPLADRTCRELVLRLLAPERERRLPDGQRPEFAAHAVREEIIGLLRALGTPS
jgi:serine/threonine protein kinase